MGRQLQSSRIRIAASAKISLSALFFLFFWAKAAALPPLAPYVPGETLEPDCVPGEANCGVVPPAASGANSDITSLGGLTTPLSIIQGGTSTATIPVAGNLLIGKTDGTYDVSTLSAGAGISVTNGDGTITIANTSSGEANTASNQGAGLGIFDVKNGLDLEFRSLVSQNPLLTLGLDVVNHEIEFTVNEGEIDLGNLAGFLDLTTQALGILPVANGGTGVDTLTDGGLLLGSGSGPIDALPVLADGTIVIGDGDTAPTTLAAFTSSGGQLLHERGGLEADISGYEGLIGISGGATTEISDLNDLNTILGSTIPAADTDTNASTLCNGTTTYLDGDGSCDDISSVYAPFTHTHAAADITSGTLVHERGGLEADVSAYNGLVRISGGSTSNVTNLSQLNTALSSTIPASDTNSSTICNGTTTYLDGDGSCDDISSVYAAFIHTHSAADITSGTLVHERGGLEADVSAYNGLVRISGGSTSNVTNLSQLNTALSSTIPAADTNASTVCNGTTTYLDGDGSCDDISSVYAPFTHTHAAADITSGTLVHERGGLEADVSAYDGFIRISGGSTSQIKSAFAQTTAPTINDDTADGYVVGSRWIDTTNDREYITLDVTAGAALWKETTLTADGSSLDAADGSPTDVISITNNGHVKTSGSTPALSSCGTNPSISGNDIAGKITVGTGVTVTGCTVTFGSAYALAPACAVSGLAVSATTTTAALSITTTALSIANTTLMYICFEY